MTINHVNLPPNSVTEIYMDNYELYRFAHAIILMQMPSSGQTAYSTREEEVFNWQTRTVNGAQKLKLFRKENP